MSGLGLWILTQSHVRGYDSYDSAVVVSATEESAKDIHPRGGRLEDPRRFFGSGDWPDDTKYITADYLGPVDSNLEDGDVVCASFNAG